MSILTLITEYCCVPVLVDKYHPCHIPFSCIICFSWRIFGLFACYLPKHEQSKDYNCRSIHEQIKGDHPLLMRNNTWDHDTDLSAIGDGDPSGVV